MLHGLRRLVHLRLLQSQLMVVLSFPFKPATKARVESILEAEKNIPIEKLVSEALKEISPFKL